MCLSNVNVSSILISQAEKLYTFDALVAIKFNILRLSGRLRTINHLEHSLIYLAITLLTPWMAALAPPPPLPKTHLTRYVIIVFFLSADLQSRIHLAASLLSATVINHALCIFNITLKGKLLEGGRKKIAGKLANILLLLTTEDLSCWLDAEMRKIRSKLKWKHIKLCAGGI